MFEEQDGVAGLEEAPEEVEGQVEAQDERVSIDVPIDVEDRGWSGPAFLVDQGTSDQFLESQLKPELLQEACRRTGVSLDLRLQEGYDHSYFFIASCIEDHLRFHARNL